MARYSANIDGSVEVRNSGWTSGGQFVDFVGRATVAFHDKDPLPLKLNVNFAPGRKFRLKVYFNCSDNFCCLS